MSRITFEISEQLHQKLAAAAAKSGRSLAEVAEQAVADYIENDEDVYKTDLCTVDNLERAFFLSIGE